MNTGDNKLTPLNEFSVTETTPAVGDILDRYNDPEAHKQIKACLDLAQLPPSLPREVMFNSTLDRLAKECPGESLSVALVKMREADAILASRKAAKKLLFLDAPLGSDNRNDPTEKDCFFSGDNGWISKLPPHLVEDQSTKAVKQIADYYNRVTPETPVAEMTPLVLAILSRNPRLDDPATPHVADAQAATKNLLAIKRHDASVGDKTNRADMIFDTNPGANVNLTNKIDLVEISLRIGIELPDFDALKAVMKDRNAVIMKTPNGEWGWAETSLLEQRFLTLKESHAKTDEALGRWAEVGRPVSWAYYTRVKPFADADRVKAFNKSITGDELIKPTPEQIREHVMNNDVEKMYPEFKMWDVKKSP